MSNPIPPPPIPSVPKEKPFEPSDPRASQGPYAPSIGAAMSFEAVLDIDRVSGGKMFQGTWLLRDDGTKYVVGYRPVQRFFRFVGKRVTVSGIPYWNSPMVQSISGTHFYITDIALAPGETAWQPEPTGLPPPPRVSTADALRALAHRWVEVEGVLGAWQAGEQRWGRTTLQLADGTTVTVEVLDDYWRSTWEPLVGTKVVVTAQVGREGGTDLNGHTEVRGRMDPDSSR